jgi:Chondroitinase B
MAESEQANCFVESSSNTQVVSTMSDLTSAVNAAPPGRNILIAPGTYTGGTLKFNRDGTEANPIVIRPQSGLGTVTINGARWKIANTSSWLTISKIHFRSSNIILCGDHNRITRCRFRNMNITCVAFGLASDKTQAPRNCRLDHCDFSDITGSISILRMRPEHWAPGGTAGPILVDYNYFHDILPPAGATGETQVLHNFGSLSQWGSDAPPGSNLIWDHNLMENIEYIGGSRSEVVVPKLKGMMFRFSTFVNIARARLFARGTGRHEVRSCWFEYPGLSPNIGYQAFGDDNLVIGNRFVGALNLWVPSGVNTASNIVTETPGGGGTNTVDDYARSGNGRFIGNRMGSGRILVGQYWDGANAWAPASGNRLEANTRDSGAPAHLLVASAGTLSPAQVNTTVRTTTTATFTRAVKLAASNVGLNAPDPLCG